MRQMVKKILRHSLYSGLFIAGLASGSDTTPETLMNENFESQPQTRWNYVSDQVMGGVSQGQLVFKTQDGESFAHMTGQVSTENNGGFIQVRSSLVKTSTTNASGVILKIRGNNQQYYIHLRSTLTLLPWQYYQASFQVTDQWQIIKLPLSDFNASSKWLPNSLKPGSIRSIGIVAFGRDHSADIQISQIGFY